MSNEIEKSIRKKTYQMKCNIFKFFCKFTLNIRKCTIWIFEIVLNHQSNEYTYM